MDWIGWMLPRSLVRAPSRAKGRHKKKNQVFFGVSPKGGGARRIQNFLSRKNLGIQIDRGGAGGSRSFGETPKKTWFLFLMPPLNPIMS